MITPATGPATIVLEVVRGRQPGLRFPVGSGPIVLGNAPGPGPAIDLAPQEQDAPRRMSARHAQIERTPSGLLLRDLGSPGGTFVNRARVERGQAIPLKTGDTIQLGPVQLRVVDAPPAASPGPPSASRPFTFLLRDGSACRSWDDFLAVSAQRWPSLRDELTSGRLSGFLAGIGRPDLVPDPDDPGSPDERLDAWIGRLPTTRPARPELEVHPRSLPVHATGGSGTVRRSLQVSNGGYRLLRTTARVEPPEASWLRIVGGPGPLVTIDSSELIVEIDLPSSGERRSAALMIEGNGGEARVPVTVGPPPDRAASPSPPVTPRASAPGAALGRFSLASRMVGGCVGAGLLRLLLVAGDRVVSPSGPAPGLLGGAVVAGALGALGGVATAIRRGSASDVPSAGFAGAIGGAMLAALAVATTRTLDATMTGPSLPVSLSGAVLVGGLLAAVSTVIWPRTEGTT